MASGRGRLLVVDIFPLVVLDDLLGVLLLASGIDNRVAVGLARGAGRGLLVLEALLVLEVVVLGLEPADHAMQLLVELVDDQGDGRRGEDEE